MMQGFRTALGSDSGGQVVQELFIELAAVLAGVDNAFHLITVNVNQKIRVRSERNGRAALDVIRHPNPINHFD
jgi:hypothetical protein